MMIKMNSVIRNSNGFEHLAETYFPNTGGATIDLFGSLSAATPFHALVLKPTATSFGTEADQQSWVGFMNDEQKRMIMVLFTSCSLENGTAGMLFKLLGIEVPDDSQGMWVISIPFEDDMSFIDSDEVQLFQVTDGTSILIPEVNLAELTGLESANMFTAVEDESGVFQGSIEEGNVSITSIAGCEIRFRFTLEQALQYLLDQMTKRQLVENKE
jgi:hypothetical protein